jgi:uracil-DNA glycosylase family 4
MIVPNKFPSLPAPFRLAIVGEAPGSDEAAVGKPFVGASGRLLRFAIGDLGFSFDQCFVGNVCQYQPPCNEIERLDPSGVELTEGKEKLNGDLQKFEPNCCLLLGNTALETFRSSREGISNFRGSMFMSDLMPIVPRKCIAAYHPAAVLRMYNLYALMKMDISKARKQAEFPELRLPQRNFILRPTLEQVATYLSVCRESELTAFDIEGYADNVGVTMISFSHVPSSGLVIPFWIDGAHYWSDIEEVEVWRLVGDFLGDAAVKKVCQNGLYETFVLGWRHQIIVRGIVHDTMFAHWELFPEFPKNLGF